jgi:hypothetical protein
VISVGNRAAHMWLDLSGRTNRFDRWRINTEEPFWQRRM